MKDPLSSGHQNKCVGITCYTARENKELLRGLFKPTTNIIKYIENAIDIPGKQMLQEVGDNYVEIWKSIS